MLSSLRDQSDERRPQPCRSPKVTVCEEKHRLVRDFLDAVHVLTVLQEQQTQAAILDDQDFSRFDLLLHAAQERKDMAKYAWMAHVESHCC
jgi:hypothetical protein